MNPYNYAASVGRALDAGATTLLDPGADGTVTVAPKGVAILVLESDGARTLQAATGVDVGAEVLVLSTAAAASVNAVDIEDGGHATFRVTLNSSGVNQWVAVESSAAVTALGPADFSTAPLAVTGDTTAYNETTLQELLDALEAFGIITNSTT